MNVSGRVDAAAGNAADKFELHYRQQLSALVDGELATDEARFLLRRLEHDDELSGCQERWQLLGDVLRGQACAPAPAGFDRRIRAAIAADAEQGGTVSVRPPRRAGWRRWGGGAALAASVAAVALFMARGQLPAPGVPETVIATAAQVPATPVVADADPATASGAEAGLAAAAPAVAAVALRRADAAARRGSATRNQQVARGVAARQAEPARAVAVQAPLPVVRHDPFADPGSVLQARPWPRSSLAPALSSGNALNASASAEGGAAFYPFEPRLPPQGAPAQPDAQPARP
ncbi:MAG: sigma-E factor negative regulatory protein [Stenotrophomonas acidaminiphila]